MVSLWKPAKIDPSEVLWFWSVKLGAAMSKNGFGQMYRKLSSTRLDLVVTPHGLGEVPSEVTAPEPDQTATESRMLVCYVLQHHSRSNALVVDAETRRL